jgi:xanthine/uracil permease
VLSRLLHLADYPVGRRPPDLAYGGIERPPAGALAGLAAQHLATALTLVAYVLAAATLAGIDAASTQAAVAATILAMGLGTLLQAWAPGIGAGAFLVHIPSPISAMLVAVAIATVGVGGLPAIGIACGVTALVVSNIIPRLRALFPPAVAGLVVAAGGLSLSAPAFFHATGLGPQDRFLEQAALVAESLSAYGAMSGSLDGGDTLAEASAARRASSDVLGIQSALAPVARNIIVSSVTLLVIVGMSVWGGKRLKLFALLGGLVAGVAATTVLGDLPSADPLAGLPAFALPAVPAFSFDVRAGMLIAFVVLATVMQLDTLGAVSLMQRMEDAHWRRPDMARIGRSIRAVGITNIASGFIGGFPTSLSTANVALCNISRATSRYIGLAVASGLVAIALLPTATMALTMIPKPVIGAVEVYAAAYLTMAGIELIMSRAMDTRIIFTVGLSIFAAVVIIAMPQLADAAPESIAFLFKSPVIVAGSTALILNLLFRLGTRRETELDLGETPADKVHQAIQDYVDMQGATWGARKDVMARVANACIEGTEALLAAGRSPLALKASFDEFNFDVEIAHAGKPLGALSSDAAGADRHFDDPYSEEAMDHAVAQASVKLLQHFADKVTTGGAGERGWLRLHFDH